jgi:hypothetical protein
MSESEDDDAWFDRILAELEAAQRTKKLREEHQWVLVLIRVLFPRSSHGLRRVDVIDRVAQRRRGAGLPMPAKIEQTIQSAYNRYSIDSEVFRSSGRPTEDALFYSPKGKNSGVWGVSLENAARWMRARRQEI